VPDAGRYVIPNAALFEANIDNRVNNPDWVFGSTVTMSENAYRTWTKGSGTVYLSSNVRQNIDAQGADLENVVSSNTSSGGLVFLSSVTMDSFRVNAVALGSAATVYFSGTSTGVARISTFTIIGSAANHVVLKPLGTQQWYLNNTSSSSVLFSEVRYSSASAGRTIFPRNSTDLGGNYNWNFSSSTVITWTGAVDNNFGNADNWDKFIVPRSTDHVVIAYVGAQPAVLDQARSFSSITIQKGAHLDLNNRNIALSVYYPVTPYGIVLLGTMTARGSEQIMTTSFETYDWDTSATTGWVQPGSIDRDHIRLRSFGRRGNLLQSRYRSIVGLRRERRRHGRSPYDG
jgi:hypothetical protein